MSERRPAPAVELARFAGLLGSEETSGAPPAPPPGPRPLRDAPAHRPRARPAIVSTVLYGVTASPPAAPAAPPPQSPTISVGKVMLDGDAISRLVQEARARDDIRDMLRAAFGRALVEVRMQSSPRGTAILAVLRQRVQVPRLKPIYTVPEGPVWGDPRETDVEDVEVEVDVTEAVLTSNYEALRRLAAEHVR